MSDPAQQEQSRAEKEMGILVVSLALWGATLLFIAVGILFLLDIIPSGNGVLIGVILLAVAFVNWLIIKVVVGKMDAELDDLPE